MTTCRASLAMLLCMLGGFIVNGLAAEENIEPALKADADVLARLEVLGDNSSCVLPGPRIIEDLGEFAKGWHRMQQTGPTGRDFTIKMAWMADRRRAFFCGANHGSPHRFNDAWEYDLASNTWVLLYTPDYNDRGPITDYDKQTLVLRDGWLRTKKGGPAHPAHTWWGLTYDPRAKAALWYCAWPSYRLQDKLDAIGAKKEDLYQGPPLWAFYPAQKKWAPIPTSQPWPRNKFGASLEYIAELDGSLWQYDNNTWRFDEVKKSWRLLCDEGASLPIETLVCHDRARKLLIAHRGPRKDDLPRTWHMSLAGDAPSGWKQVLESADSPNGHDARSWMYFDPVGKVALLYERESKNIWSYDPAEVRWTKLQPDGPAPPFEERERVLAYFDPPRNVLVVIGYDSVWCYRYRRAK
ncbi:MAG: hypothetical protein RIC55_34765 [Pirellulaceae bacterium]